MSSFALRLFSRRCSQLGKQGRDRIALFIVEAEEVAIFEEDVVVNLDANLDRQCREKWANATRACYHLTHRGVDFGFVGADILALLRLTMWRGIMICIIIVGV